MPDTQTLSPRKARRSAARAVIAALPDTPVIAQTLQTIHKRRVGRPPMYTDDIAKRVIDMVSAGESMATIAKTQGLPHYNTIYEWIDNRPEFATAYARAKEQSADNLAAEIIVLADAPIPAGMRGPEASAWVQRQRMRVDARKWIAAKLKPKVYGDRVDLTVRDERISILGALEAARARVIDVEDVTPVIAYSTVEKDSNEGGGGVGPTMVV